MEDKIVQAAVVAILTPIYERRCVAKVQPCAIPGFRL